MLTSLASHGVSETDNADKIELHKSAKDTDPD